MDQDYRFKRQKYLWEPWNIYVNILIRENLAKCMSWSAKVNIFKSICLHSITCFLFALEINKPKQEARQESWTSVTNSLSYSFGLSYTEVEIYISDISCTVSAMVNRQANTGCEWSSSTVITLISNPVFIKPNKHHQCCCRSLNLYILTRFIVQQVRNIDITCLTWSFNDTSVLQFWFWYTQN